eukprot:Gregarina_sp_Pseudo_9__59@NODE_103_length_4267_cov_30_934721_g95_i0_p7_GENE_NODE_103_length_4267_cov_30_934721_g95_i0NODE_103_length_4267_cov_30_934721_g95_i0_p7_ORF_typecomplete_len121_score1_95_NODE_103_length_4267_cov_30_934721_g95_i037584120
MKTLVGISDLFACTHVCSLVSGAAACDSTSTRASDVTFVPSRLFSSPLDDVCRVDNEEKATCVSPPHASVRRRDSLGCYPLCPLRHSSSSLRPAEPKFVSGAQVRLVVERFAFTSTYASL